MASLLDNPDLIAAAIQAAFDAVPTADKDKPEAYHERFVLEVLRRVQETYDPNDNAKVDLAEGLGTKYLNESGIADKRIIYYDQPSNKLVYGPVGGLMGGAMVVPLTTDQTVMYSKTGSTLVAGHTPFDASKLSGTFALRAVGWVSGPTAGLQATAKLYNLTDGEYVTGASVSTTATTPTILTSGSLTVGSAAGNLKDSEKLYEVRMFLNNGANVADVASFGQVAILVTF